MAEDAPRAPGRRESARVAAVQALYQIDLSGAAAADVIAEFRDHRLDKSSDKDLFSSIVATAAVKREEIDTLLSSALAEGWKIERLDAVLRALLRAGVGELQEPDGVPARVLLDQYVDVAHAFFTGKEVGFVNGVLDGLARRLRPQEVEGKRAGHTAKER